MLEIRKISIKDKQYPEELRKIDNPPLNLFYKGNLPQTKSRGFAIVGSRKYSFYGKQITLKIGSDLAEAGLIIISGLAPGIDTFAHLAAVRKNKPTIAVLGTGIDEKSIYPKSNIELSRQIIKTGGCLISEYPPGTPGNQTNFPERNRIVSGLSLGVLVVEAQQKSGTLITARWAKKQKKKIFAVPGQIYSLNSKGCHYLIKNGAKLVEESNDILSEFNNDFPLLI